MKTELSHSRLPLDVDYEREKTNATCFYASLSYTYMVINESRFRVRPYFTLPTIETSAKTREAVATVLEFVWDYIHMQGVV